MGPLAPPVVLALVLAASSFGCVIRLDDRGIEGSGAIVSETRPVSTFDRLAVEDEFDVEVTVGPAVSLSITGDQNLLAHVRTEVRNGTLHIEEERGLDPTEAIRVRVTALGLRRLESSGASSVRATGIRAETFRTSVSGSSDVTAEGDFGDLDVSISGSGRIRMRGTADAIDASVSGSGDLDLAGVAARTARVRVSGTGDAVVHVFERLQASVSGSGDVRYLGDPRVESSVSGSGSVRPARSDRDLSVRGARGTSGTRSRGR